MSYISAVFFMNQKGETLISRFFRNDVNRAAADSFRLNVIAAKEIRSPIRTVGDVIFLFIRVENVYIVAVTKQNVNCVLVFEVLYKFVDIFKKYWGGYFTEEGVRNNFVLIYELLDEMVDYGVPQNCGEEMLKVHITQKGTFSKKNVKKLEAETKKALEQITGKVSWRPEGLKYKKNEVFIDVLESVNVLISAKGNVLRSDVSGEVKVKAFLSGMPECRFGMNDKVVMDKESPDNDVVGAVPVQQKNKRTNGIEIDDCTFHQCVRLGKFDTDRTISFIPPDGEFSLMKYRTTENIHMPFRIFPIVNEIGRTRVEVKVNVKAVFDSKNMFGIDVVVNVPTPKNTAVCKIHVLAGKAKYVPTEDAIIWRIKKFPADTEYSLSAEIQLVESNLIEKKAWSRPPISMQFQVPMYTASGLHVRFLKVVEPKLNYNTIKWVRYVTKAGSYLNRI
eukprot:TRINITY_DN2336_c0_g1_i1.p1 TRINITY_DN2336_c0_g1~~TRINITY_DN2336_c0_g1_i1.p1  ORF type:complete len:448 (+),score=88.52 TRINITY_DN2336_c0_g1_i1:69-1412(+)